jgi:hypothetical protein
MEPTRAKRRCSPRTAECNPTCCRGSTPAAASEWGQVVSGTALRLSLDSAHHWNRRRQQLNGGGAPVSVRFFMGTRAMGGALVDDAGHLLGLGHKRLC